MAELGIETGINKAILIYKAKAPVINNSQTDHITAPSQAVLKS